MALSSEAAVWTHSDVRHTPGLVLMLLLDDASLLVDDCLEFS